MDVQSRTEDSEADPEMRIIGSKVRTFPCVFDYFHGSSGITCQVVQFSLHTHVHSGRPHGLKFRRTFKSNRDSLTYKCYPLQIIHSTRKLLLQVQVERYIT